MKRLAKHALAAIMLLSVLSLTFTPTQAQTLREKIIAHIKARSQQAQPIDPSAYLPGSTRVSVAYGSDAEQSLDVYLPPNAHNAPIIVMVHGGAWAIGDKNSRGVVENKLKHWLPKGFILISVNYRMLPEAPINVQAQDVAHALSFVQGHAAQWGADGNRIILMGHSAGGHLVALISANPQWVRDAGGQRWRGTVVLDAGAIDVAAVMSRQHARFYDDAFGADPKYWDFVSPAAQIKPDAIPMLLICSLKRADHSCDQSEAFARKLRATGQPVPVSEQDLTHEEVNATLGLDSAYTQSVDAFISARFAN